LISYNFLEKKKKVLNVIIFKEIKKKKFKKILVLKILRLLIALKHSFKGFKGQKALFKPFDIFLMLAVKKSKTMRDCPSPFSLGDGRLS